MTKKQLTEEPMTEDLTTETDTNEQDVHNVDTTEGVTTSDTTEDVATTDAPEDVEGGDVDGSDDPSDAETFPREYVEKLRKEAADARVKAKRADDLAARLHTALVAATGRLADPSDLPFDDAHLEDADALNAAVDELLARKPHLASRRPVGSIGQGATSPADSVSLAGILRHNAF
ncbi:hypothetical protein [Dermacoccus nishinomiyaensis]|uniref:hypothetical protein n=1 Tax=Dermacoccus nishinomiyaensis TaxID=1274 RepID=UPI0033AF88D8